MLRRSSLAAAAGLAAAVTLVMPAVATARTAEHVGLNNSFTSSTVHLTSSASHSVVPLKAAAFPSSTSTVIGSIGFIDGEQCGYFWSASRGDSVEQTISGPHAIKKATLKLDVTDNVLSGAEVDWTVSINGKDVGSFVISEGQLGAVTKTFKFAKMKGGSYDVKMRVTNEVPSGGGSIALRYAGDGPHSITLKKK